MTFRAPLIAVGREILPALRRGSRIDIDRGDLQRGRFAAQENRLDPRTAAQIRRAGGPLRVRKMREQHGVRTDRKGAGALSKQRPVRP